MERSGWARVGPMSGLLFAGVLVAVGVQAMGTDPGVRPGDPTAEIAEAMAGTFGSLSWPWLLALMVGIAAFVVFLADLQQRVRDAIPSARRWMSTVVLAGGLLIIVAILVQVLLVAGLRTVADRGVEDPAVAATLFVLTWEGMVTIIPGIAAMTSAAAVASLRYRALPAWLGALAALAFVIGLTFYWVPVWLVWVAAVSLTLMLRREPVPTPERSAA